MMPPSELRTRVLDAVRREPALDRKRAQRGVAIAMAAGLALSLSIFLSIGGARLAGRPSAFVALVACGWCAIALLSTWIGVRRGSSMLGRPRSWLAMIVVLAGPAFVTWLVLATALWPEMRETAPASTTLHVACFVFTNLFALGPFAALVYARRGTDPIHPRATGAAVGTVSGVWAGILIDLHCPVSTTMHVAFAHVGPIVVFAFLGAFIGKKLIGLRPPGA